MPYLFIENFEAGLDTRKSRFTAPPGSLRQCINAHISRGKEIEKRKAFTGQGLMDSALEGLLGIGGQLFTFVGADSSYEEVPPGVNVVSLDFGGLDSIARVHSVESFAGKPYVVAQTNFGGKIRHFYDGQEVTDWTTISADLADKETVARYLAEKLKANLRYEVRREGTRLVFTAREPNFEIAGGNTFVEDAGVDPPLITVTLLQEGEDPSPAVAASASFDITGGTSDPGVNTIDEVTVDGFDLIGSPVDHTGDSGTTAQEIVDRVNAGGPYTASRSANTVTISADPALGASANGRELVVGVTGDVTVSSTLQNLSGGADATQGQRSIVEVTVDVYDADREYAVRVTEEDGSTLVVRIEGKSSAMPLAVKTLRQKMYAVTGSLVYFSGFRGGYDGANQTPALPDPTAWQNFDNETDEYVIGAGVINLAEQAPRSDVAVGLAVYQNRLAVFSSQNIQIWTMDPDPDLNRLDQVLLNIGAVASQGIVEYGDTDVFFLSTTGVRSLRARDSSNLASTSDVGDPIDKELTTYLRTLTPGQVAEAKAVVEPDDSRYLLAVGDRVYVFSNFSGSRVSAWSRYEMDVDVKYWATAGGRLYFQPDDSGDVPLYLYGGEDGETYDSSPVTVELPFLDAGNPAGRKSLRGIDLGIEGTWEVEFASEPNNPDAKELIGTATESTYGSFRQVRANAVSTHFSLLLTNEDEGPAVLANAVLHYDDIKAD